MFFPVPPRNESDGSRCVTVAPEKGATMRRWSLLEAYALSVCLGMLVWFIIASYLFGVGLVAGKIPEFTIDYWTYSEHQSNETFWERRVRFRSPADPRPSDDVLTAEREQSWRTALELERRNGLRRAASALFGLAVSSVAFWAHWRIARRARREDRDWIPPAERLGKMGFGGGEAEPIAAADGGRDAGHA